MNPLYTFLQIALTIITVLLTIKHFDSIENFINKHIPIITIFLNKICDIMF